MKSHGAIYAALGVLLVAAPCASVAQEPLQKALRTFDATQLAPDRYTVIRRLWVDSWRTAFDVPAHPESSAALAQLSEEAVKAGADALTNVVCLNDDRAWFRRGYFCYALAVKLK
ncbi:MAG TPA: hypothetical protein VFC14_03820 [Burkholderiales bacterium]|nr:hypothetical protein [Burkholderiales bacterium]